MTWPEQKESADQISGDIFDRMKAGEPIRLNDPEYPKIWGRGCSHT
jgi:hypothetical protein